MELIHASAYLAILNIKACALEKGYFKIVVEVDRKHWNPFGSVHGRVYASAIDAIAYWAAYCEMDEDAGFTPLDLCGNNLSFARTGAITVDGRVIRSGGSIFLCEAVATDESGQ